MLGAVLVGLTLLLSTSIATWVLAKIGIIVQKICEYFKLVYQLNK
ncbi:hypothetical protein [Mycoplasmopsis edwardii]|nr:hypothetical protein [Mycoplasmopsis edwardii]